MIDRPDPYQQSAMQFVVAVFVIATITSLFWIGVGSYEIESRVKREQGA